MSKLREDRENMIRAKNALEISDSAKMNVHMDKLDVAMEELNDLKGVWGALLPVYVSKHFFGVSEWVLLFYTLLLIFNDFIESS